MPSGPVMKTCQPSSARVRPLAIATATLNRIVVVTSSPLDACTMKATTTPFAQRPMSLSAGNFLAISVPAPLMHEAGSSRSSVMLGCCNSRSGIDRHK